MFVFMIFAIGGLHLFNGILKKRCVDSVTQALIIPEKICNDNSVCELNQICLKNFENPDWGVTNFDNIGSSLLMVF